MNGIAGFVKEFLIPGSHWFLLIGLTAGVLLLAGPIPGRTWARRWLVVLAASYWILSVPVVAEWLAAATIVEAQPKASLDGIQAVVALANGVHRHKAARIEINTLAEESVYTVLETVRQYRQLGSPLVIASGGVSHPAYYEGTEAEVLRDALVAQGVPADRIVLEQESGTTREQAVNIAPILRARGIQRFALVTSPIHMPRALSVFRSQALQPVPAPSAYGSVGSAPFHSRWRPSVTASFISERAVYEDLGRLYYWGRGWIGRSED